MEISDIRKRVRLAVEQHRKAAAERHQRADAAAAAYEAFLQRSAVPVFRMFGNVARADGFPFGVNTPAGGVRLVSDRAERDFVEIFLDATVDPPRVGTRVSRQRGRNVVEREGLLEPDVPIGELDDEAVLSFLIDAIGTFVDR
jgi:hypothetical protein